MNPNSMNRAATLEHLYRKLLSRRTSQLDNMLRRHCRLRRCRLKSSGVSYEWTLAGWTPILSVTDQPECK